MPIFNEEPTLALCVQRVLEQPLVMELIAVDDSSTDGSWAILEQLAQNDPRIHAFRQPMNRGKGAAIARAVSQASAPFVIIQDADLEYDPSDYAMVLGPLLEGRADAVFGSRFKGAGPHRVLYFWHYVGNRVLTLLSNMITNVNLTDMECCYKAFRREVIQRVPLREERFGIEPELVTKAARAGLRLYEVSVSYHGRTYAEGKKIGWRDGLAAIWCLLKYGLARK